jgi:hypothetical protein
VDLENLRWHGILTHDVDPKEFTKVLWWSFYEGDASFEHFVEETLEYLDLEVPQAEHRQVEELLKAMKSQKLLLIMDGFERALRAYNSMDAPYQGDESLPSVERNEDRKWLIWGTFDLVSKIILRRSSQVYHPNKGRKLAMNLTVLIKTQNDFTKCLLFAGHE